MPLEFGRFLLLRGKIDYRELIAALVWQRQQRPSLGAIARRWGWLSDGQIVAILKHHGPYRRFGSRAVSLGFLTGTQLRILLYHQQSLQKRLGQFFVEQGLLSSAEIEQLAREFHSHNRRYARG